MAKNRTLVYIVLSDDRIIHGYGIDERSVYDYVINSEEDLEIVESFVTDVYKSYLVTNHLFIDARC